MTAELEDASSKLASRDVKEEKVDTPDSRASFQISPSYWAAGRSFKGSAFTPPSNLFIICGAQETVELQALKEVSSLSQLSLSCGICLLLEGSDESLLSC